jgi:pimeloyl-ACP methyl ester carboxylesterase
MLRFLESVGLDLNGTSCEVRTKIAEQFRFDTDCYFREMAALDRSMSVPCTLIVSDTDRFTPHIHKAQQRWQPYFKNPVKMIVIHDVNHYFHMQKPDEIATAILDAN